MGGLGKGVTFVPLSVLSVLARPWSRRFLPRWRAGGGARNLGFDVRQDDQRSPTRRHESVSVKLYSDEQIQDVTSSMLPALSQVAPAGRVRSPRGCDGVRLHRPFGAARFP